MTKTLREKLARAQFGEPSWHWPSGGPTEGVREVYRQSADRFIAIIADHLGITVEALEGDGVREAVEALEPFSVAADRADERAAEVERLGMGRLSDTASPGLGINFGHLRRARAARAKLKGDPPQETDN